MREYSFGTYFTKDKDEILPEKEAKGKE